MVVNDGSVIGAETLRRASNRLLHEAPTFLYLGS